MTRDIRGLTSASLGTVSGRVGSAQENSQETPGQILLFVFAGLIGVSVGLLLALLVCCLAGWCLGFLAK